MFCREAANFTSPRWGEVDGARDLLARACADRAAQRGLPSLGRHGTVVQAQIRENRGPVNVNRDLLGAALRSDVLGAHERRDDQGVDRGALEPLADELPLGVAELGEAGVVDAEAVSGPLGLGMADEEELHGPDTIGWV